MREPIRAPPESKKSKKSKKTKKAKKAQKLVGTKFFKAGTQNQLILQDYWGTGNTFTMDDLRTDLNIASPGARISELKESGFVVKSKNSDVHEGFPGRPHMVYSIPKRRATA